MSKRAGLKAAKTRHKCKLCGKRRVLQRSHLMPKALYRMTKKEGGPLGDPILVTRETTGQTGRQFWAHLLCSECEKRFNDGGEAYVMGQVHNGERFPLLERLNVAMPVQAAPGIALFSGRAMGVDTDRLAYFAMSIFWRASVRRWPSHGGGQIWKSLGADEDRVRRYLLGETPFPENMVLLITVCNDWQSQGSFFSPAAVRGAPASFGLQTRGIYFRLFVGPDIPEGARRTGCIPSEARYVALGDCFKISFGAFRYLRETTREAAGLRDAVGKGR
jgi:hypothetical protein